MRHDEFWKPAAEKLVSVCGRDLLENGDISKIREKLQHIKKPKGAEAPFLTRRRKQWQKNAR